MPQPSDTWDKMTNKERITFLATDVMGWAVWHADGSEGEQQRRIDALSYKTIFLDTELGVKWNPLTDWNHLMQVVQKLGPKWNCFTEEDGRQTIFVHQNPQEAICRAIYLHQHEL